MNQKVMAKQNDNVICESCGGSGARRYQLFSFDELEGGSNGFHDEREVVLCIGCARRERAQLQTTSEQSEGLTREELIAELDCFFAASGVFDICGR